MDPKTEQVARFLEDFAREVEDESRTLPMMAKDDKSWAGFTHEAEKLLRLIEAKS